jgi:hypothetical protein
MSRHDEIRLERGQDALSTRAVADTTTAQLKLERSEIHDGIRGIQSTDDPDPIYAETETALFRRLKLVEAELKKRGVT